MDGDVAPLKEIVALKHKYDLKIYLDEAHGFGVFGTNGAGYANSIGLSSDIDVTIITLGKALASCGAFIISTPEIREVLINRMRTLIFSTALPPINLQWSRFMIEKLPSFSQRREHLHRLIEATNSINKGESTTQILPLMTYDNATTQRVTSQLRGAGFWVTPIRTPTVPIGKSRIRISLTSSLELQDIHRFIEIVESK